MGGGGLGGFFKAVPIVSSIASLVMGGLSAADASKQAKKQQKYFESQAEYDRYQQEQARIAAEQEAQRDYEANMADYESRVATIEKWVDYWKQVEENPAEMHPEYSTYRTSVERAGRAEQQNLADALRRQGVTGGRQQQLIQDIAKRSQSQLAQALTQTSKEAKSKQIELESMMPEKPSLGQGRVQYAPLTAQYTGSPQATFQSPDFSGLGAASASIASLASQQQTTDESLISSLAKAGTVGTSDYSFFKEGEEEELFPTLFGG